MIYTIDRLVIASARSCLPSLLICIVHIVSTSNQQPILASLAYDRVYIYILLYRCTIARTTTTTLVARTSTGNKKKVLRISLPPGILEWRGEGPTCNRRIIASALSMSPFPTHSSNRAHHVNQQPQQPTAHFLAVDRASSFGVWSFSRFPGFGFFRLAFSSPLPGMVCPVWSKPLCGGRVYQYSVHTGDSRPFFPLFFSHHVQPS